MGAAAAAFAVTTGLVRAIGERLAPEAVFAMDCETPVVALTIDDGPDPETTAEILAVLERHGATATFFVIGERALEHPGVLTDIVAQGSELGNHTFTETHSNEVPPSELVHGIVKTHHVVSGFGPVRWLRPGGGRMTEVIEEVAEVRGYRIALADVYPFDHLLRWPAAQRAYVLWAVEPGSIVALHDVGERGERTAQMLEGMLPALSDDGYRVVSLSEMAQADGCW